MTRRFSAPVLAILFFLFAAGPGLAQVLVPPNNEVAALLENVGKFEKILEKTALSDQEIATAEVLGTDIRRRSLQCITSVKAEIDRIKTLVGEAPKVDTGTGTDSTARKISELQTELGTCRDIVLRADSADTKLELLKNRRQAARFGARGRNVVDTITGAFSATADWNSIRRPMAGLVEFPRAPTPLEGLLIGGLTLLGAGLGLRLRTSRSRETRLAPMVLGATGLMAGLTLSYAPEPVVAIVIGWQMLAIGCLMLLSASLPRPATEPDRARTGWRIGGFLLASLVSYHLALAFDNALPIPEVEFARLVVFAAMFAAAIPASRHIRFLPLFEWAWKPIRAGFLLGFALALVSEIAGYRAFASFVLTGLAGTLIAIILYSLVERGGEAIIASLNSGNAPWSVAIKKSFGFPAHEPVPGLPWLRLFFEILIFTGFAFGVASMWGLSQATRETFMRYAVDGFQIWGINFVPGRIIGGILIFSLLLMVSRRVRDIADRRWTVDLKLETGGREALVTLIGYGGVVVAVLAGLSWAGFSFDKIAIVAGALSVGIGFGLQNVVSNFVSGLIMLFEQPIRTGDWVLVGDTEGIVKKIRVRATEIQKFDRTEVIVPNADFITGAVTNFTLRNSIGRIFLPIGVAYGSDTGLVRDLLTDIVRNHPKILTSSSLAPDPSVYFTAFGDSSLTFEIRAYVADVGKRLSVTSDLHYAIDKAFRDNGIEIPFPQSDIHVRDWPAITTTDNG